MDSPMRRSAPSRTRIGRHDQCRGAGLFRTDGQLRSSLPFAQIRSHSQLEYYRIKSIFEGVKHGERPIDGAGEIAAHEAGIATWKEKLQVAQQRLDEIETAGRQAAFVGVKKSRPNSR